MAVLLHMAEDAVALTATAIRTLARRLHLQQWSLTEPPSLSQLQICQNLQLARPVPAVGFCAGKMLVRKRDAVLLDTRAAQRAALQLDRLRLAKFRRRHQISQLLGGLALARLRLGDY
jgi:hypothetical protein